MKNLKQIDKFEQINEFYAGLEKKVELKKEMVERGYNDMVRERSLEGRELCYDLMKAMMEGLDAEKAQIRKFRSKEISDLFCESEEMEALQKEAEDNGAEIWNNER